MIRVSLSFALVVACTPNSNSGLVATPVSDPPVIVAPEADASVGQTRTLQDTVALGPKLCGCGLCEPVSSGDGCKADGDCAPETPCHAMACVAKAKSTPRTKDIMCTQEVRCASADANACGCVAGVCTLYKKK